MADTTSPTQFTVEQISKRRLVQDGRTEPGDGQNHRRDVVHSGQVEFDQAASEAPALEGRRLAVRVASNQTGKPGGVFTVAAFWTARFQSLRVSGSREWRRSRTPVPQSTRASSPPPRWRGALALPSPRGFLDPAGAGAASAARSGLRTPLGLHEAPTSAPRWSGALALPSPWGLPDPAGASAASSPCSGLRTPLGLHEAPTEVLLGGERIVSVAAQREIVRRGRAAAAVRLEMVQLEKRGFATSNASAVDVGAA